MDHKVIRPNIFYATAFQFLQLVVYVGIGILCYRIIVFFVGFEIIPYIIDTLKSLGFESLKTVLEFLEDKISTWFIALMASITVFLMNSVNNKFEVIGNKIILKKGFINIQKQEFIFDEIKRYESEKDLGFLNSGTLHIMTMYGDRITLDFVLNLKKAQEYLDELIRMNNSIPVSSGKR